ncbi:MULTISPECIES: HGGxSTG domain-containing protein [Pseudomonas]|uniref:HGGxSTG domain-containing protein n=1 Tax=Pseudomonas TaxID=286 RepID=UPI000B034905|nr:MULTISPECIES: HGGxSTG domain-containing protein [Pseudomonas]
MAQCGAKTRSGEPCKRHAVPGSSKCKLHGGAASKANKANKHAAKPGSIYSQFLTDEENDVLASIDLGRVDDELRLTRIRLMRALARENEFGNELEIDSEKLETGEHGGTTTTSKVRDYSGLIDRLTARVESLERTKEDLETRRLTNEKLRRELNPPKDDTPDHAVAEYTLSPDEDVPTSPHL